MTGAHAQTAATAPEKVQKLESFVVTGSYIPTNETAFTAGISPVVRIDRKVIDGVVNGAARGFVHAASAAWRFDSVVVDGAVNGLATLSRRAGSQLRALQTGRLQSYQRLILAAVVLLMLFLVVKGA